MADDIKKQHISTNERIKWTNHLGAAGISHHPLGNGTTAGFSTNDYSNTEKNTLKTLNDNMGTTRITINSTAPINPVVNKEIWIDLSTTVPKLKVYKSTGWQAIGTVFI